LSGQKPASDPDPGRVFYPRKIAVKRSNLWDRMFPARSDDQRIVWEKCMGAGDLTDEFCVRRVRHNNESGKKIVQMADEFIREAVSFIADVFLELSCPGDPEFIFGNQPESNKECLFIHRHTCGAGTGKCLSKSHGLFVLSLFQ